MKKGFVNSRRELWHELRNWLYNARRVVIAGIGNPLRRDDFVGVHIVRKMRDRISKSVCLIECETVPESFIEPITEFEPTHILVIDAALLDLKPGSSMLIERGQMAVVPPISTHALPLQIFCDYIEGTLEAKIALLMIQPGDTSFGEGLTEEVEKTAEYLTNLLLKILP